MDLSDSNGNRVHLMCSTCINSFHPENLPPSSSFKFDFCPHQKSDKSRHQVLIKCTKIYDPLNSGRTSIYGMSVTLQYSIHQDTPTIYTLVKRFFSVTAPAGNILPGTILLYYKSRRHVQMGNIFIFNTFNILYLFICQIVWDT